MGRDFTHAFIIDEANASICKEELPTLVVALSIEFCAQGYGDKIALKFADRNRDVESGPGPDGDEVRSSVVGYRGHFIFFNPLR